MYFWLALALIFASLEAIAVARNLRALEYIAKPSLMVCLFSWLYSTTGLQGKALWFGLGILLSLLGDVLFMFQLDRLFLWGLVAFLFAHVAYITGLREGWESIHLWSGLVGILIAILAGFLLRRITGAMQANDQGKLLIPVVIYGIVISLMLYTAILSIYDPAWGSRAALLVSAGAFFFVASDAVLAWNRFVSPIENGRVLNMVLYHLGQIGLITGVIRQFG